MKKILSIVLYTISSICFTIYMVITTSSLFNVTIFEQVIFLSIICLLLHFGGMMLSKHLNNNKPMKINLIIYIFIFFILFIRVTTIAQDNSRNINIIFNASKQSVDNYISTRFNIIPFKSIYSYIVNTESLSISVIILNLLGNLVLLMPLAIMLPLVFKKQNELKLFLPTILFISIIVEIMQLVFMLGSFDIDDIILNVSGALIMYKIFIMKNINSLFKKIFLLDKTT